jgi:hypothetical protein
MSFSDLKVSTSTIMVYTNMEFDLAKIFENVHVTPTEAIYTKKQRSIDKKKISAPYGSIVSIQTKNFIRGLNTRKSQKQWCTICRPTVETGGREKKIMSCVEVSCECVPPKEGVKEIRYFCNRCNKTYKSSELKKISHFLNQITLDFSIGPEFPMLNVMIFKDSIKVAGCKNEEDAKNMVMYIWEKYLSPIQGVVTFRDPPAIKGGGENDVNPSAPKPCFFFETVMKNYGFNLGFCILREPLNILMNESKFSDKVYMSEYESTGHTNVNIKMFSIKPPGFTYTKITDEKFNSSQNTLGGDTRFRKEEVEKIEYKKEKPEKDEYITFIVFSSSEVILSGKYTENMREMYNFFRKIIGDNKNILEEKLKD